MCLLVLGFSANSFTMPISDFRKKKLLYVFNVFFGKIVLWYGIEKCNFFNTFFLSFHSDVNQSGEIDKKDFELAIEVKCQYYILNK